MDENVVREGIEPIHLDKGWDIIGVGDFNDDGFGDLALKNAEGWVAVWLRAGRTGTTIIYAGDRPMAGQVIGIW